MAAKTKITVDEFLKKNPTFRSAKGFKRIFRPLSTGLLKLDALIGIGGIPLQYFTRIMGVEGTGKTTLCYSLSRSALAEGMNVLWLDSEHTFDWFRFGITDQDIPDGQHFIVNDGGGNPLTIEEVVMVTNDLLQATTNGWLVIVDSYDNLSSNRRLDADESASLVADRAKILTAWMPKIQTILFNTNSALVFVHQARAQISTMKANYDPVQFNGAWAIKHGNHLEMRLRPVEQIKVGDLVVGRNIKVSLPHNKVGPSLVAATFSLYNSDYVQTGLDPIGEVIEIAVGQKLIEKKSSWFRYGDETLQGLESVRTFFVAHPSEYSLLREKVVAGLTFESGDDDE